MMHPMAAPVVNPDAMLFKQDDVIGKVSVVAAYILMMVSSQLSRMGAFGATIGEISGKNPSYVVPDGRTFAIWSLIYLLWLVFVVAQWMPTPDMEMLLQRRCCWPMGPSVRFCIAGAFVCSALWSPVYVQGAFALAFLIILAYLVFLLAAMMEVNSRTTSNAVQYLLFAAPISTNASWLLVATIANFFTVAGEQGWKDAYGVSGTVSAALLVIIVVTALGCLMGVANRDPAWALVAAWALRGIYRAQTGARDSFPTEAMSPVLAQAAFWGSILTLIASMAGIVLMTISYNQRQNFIHPQPVAMVPQF